MHLGYQVLANSKSKFYEPLPRCSLKQIRHTWPHSVCLLQTGWMKGQILRGYWELWDSIHGICSAVWMLPSREIIYSIYTYIIWGQSDSTTGKDFALHVTNPVQFLKFHMVPQVPPAVIPACRARDNHWALLDMPYTHKHIHVSY